MPQGYSQPAQPNAQSHHDTGRPPQNQYLQFRENNDGSQNKLRPAAPPQMNTSTEQTNGFP